MTDTPRTYAALQTLLGDSQLPGAITAQDIRDFMVSVPGLVGVFNVMEPRFGAVGNGIADDSAAFQAAHDALPAYGGTIILPSPSSSYLLSSAVSITKRCKFIGMGKLAVPIVCGTANSAFTATFTGGYLEFENLFIQGDATSGTTGKAFNIVGTSAGNKLTNLRIVNCYVKDFSAPIVVKFVDGYVLSDVFVFQGVSGITSTCIDLTFSVGGELNKVRTSGVTTQPVRSLHVGSDIDTLQVIGCEFYHSGGIVQNNVETGATFAPRYINYDRTNVEVGKATDATNDVCLNLLAGNRINVTDCRLLAGYNGININSTKTVTVSGGNVYANQQHGIIVGTAARGTKFLGVQIVDNGQAATNTYRNLLLNGACTGVQILGCTFRTNFEDVTGVLVSYHLSIGASSVNITIADNDFPDAGGTAVYNLGGSVTGLAMRNNQVRGSETSGSITLTAGTTTVVANKNVHNYCRVHIMASNSAAAALLAGASGIFVTSKTNETSFQLTHGTAAGTETFDYTIN